MFFNGLLTKNIEIKISPNNDGSIKPLTKRRRRRISDRLDMGLRTDFHVITLYLFIIRHNQSQHQYVTNYLTGNSCYYKSYSVVVKLLGETILMIKLQENRNKI